MTAVEATKRVVLGDAEARRKIAEALDTTLVVEAAAGTGKTTALVGRIVALLRTGRATLGGIIAVTFTDKAAGEMKLRLRAKIEEARAAAKDEPEVRARFDRSLAELETARIGTIHSLCAELLRERPIEARVDPLFEVAGPDDVRALYGAAFDAWFERTLASPPEGVRRLLRQRPRGRGQRTPRQLLFDDGRRFAVELRDFDGLWRREPLDRIGILEKAFAALESLGPLVTQVAKVDDWAAKSLRELGRFVADVKHKESVRGRDYDGLEAELRDLLGWKAWNWKGGGEWVVRGVLRRSEVLERRAAVRELLEEAVAELDADLAACLRSDLQPLVAAYEARKRRSGQLDFLDLLVRTRDLVRDDGAVRRELQARFTHVLVDEFQDTDPLQAEILLLLAAREPTETDWTRAVPHDGKLFVVGDPKQSIYRFRRADVALYEAVKARLVAAGAEVCYLATSFRGRPELQSAINAAFSAVMRGGESGIQADYVALQPARPELGEQPSIVALPAPKVYDEWGKLAKYRVEASLPDAVGAFVEWLVNESGWKVTEREAPEVLVPIEPRHVCLLFKRMQSFGEDLSRSYVRALEVRRIPHVLVGGRSFHEREEVLALRNALTAIEWPDDELALYATLRGPLFALSDEQLLVYKDRFRSLHPVRRVEESVKVDPTFGEVQRALDVLGALHRQRNWRPIADTISRLLAATRAHAGIAIWPSGEQALANLLRVTDLARRFEAGGTTSFRAFVERLEEDADGGEASEAPVVEEGTDGVRMMTVHRAKGLEFPVVILVEPTALPVGRAPSRWVDPAARLWAVPLAGATPVELLENAEEVLERDRAEAVRLAYVAATRARDLLVVPTVGDEEVEGWLSPLWPAIYPELAAKRQPSVAPMVKPFVGTDTVLERPAKAPVPSVSVAPGLHAPRAGTHRVVWWDPAVLELDRTADVGLRQEKILADDEGSVASGAGERAHAAWKVEKDRVLATGAQPSVFVRTPTEERGSDAVLAATTAPPAVPIEETSAVRKDRPRGKRFGTLVHAVLADVKLDATRAEITHVAKTHARPPLRAPDAEVEAAIEAVELALAHPVMRRAREAELRGECLREAPIVLVQPGDLLIDGVVDLAFRELAPDGPRWVVVDFKTDAELGDRRAAYDVQLGLYVQAIEAATGERATALLLHV